MKDHITCTILLLLFWQKYFHSFSPLSLYLSTFQWFLPFIINFFHLYFLIFLFLLVSSIFFLFFMLPFISSFLFLVTFFSFLPSLIFTAFLSYTEMQVFPFSRLSRFSSYVRCTDKIISVITLTGSDALHGINYMIFFEDFFIWRLFSSWY